jgi:hypothetical protein
MRSIPVRFLLCTGFSYSPVCLNPVQHNLKDKNFLASKGRITPKIKKKTFSQRKKKEPDMQITGTSPVLG